MKQQCPMCAGTDVSHEIGPPCLWETIEAERQRERAADEEEEFRRWSEHLTDSDMPY